MASIYRQKGDYERALDLYFKSMEIYRNNGLIKQESDALNGIGLVYQTLKQYEKSLDYLMESLSLRKQLGDVRPIANSINNIASAHYCLDEFDLSESYYREYLKLVSQTTDYHGMAGAYLNLGNIHKARLNIDSSMYYTTSALELFSTLKDSQNMAMSQNNLGFLHLRKGEEKEALDYLNQSYNYASHHQLMDLRENSIYGLITASEETGNFKAALEYQETLLSIRDTMFSTQIADRVAFYQEKYLSKKKENEILTLKAESLTSKQEAQQNRLYRNMALTIGGVAILLSMLLLVMYGQRKKIHAQKEELLLKEQEELKHEEELRKKEIEIKDRELTALATHVVQKNEILGKINLKLKGVQNEHEGINFNDLDGLIRDSVNMDKDWDTFKRHFLSVHPNFFNYLTREYPVLSANDMRICAYIRMNLSTKEIAILMNITPKSVRMNRYRLKKKLALSEERDVTEFLLSI